MDITAYVEEAVRKSGMGEGICVLSTRHTTTSIIINENEAGLREDILDLLERLVPAGADYLHDRDR